MQKESYQKLENFIEAVRNHIAPLLEENRFFRFERIHTDVPLAEVKFLSPEVELAMYYSNYCDIDITFCRRGSSQRQRFSLSEMLEASLGAGHNEESGYQASTPERMEFCMTAIADILRKSGGPALAGDRDFYAVMEMVQRARMLEAETERIVDPIRQKAAEAWKQRDYEKVCELYGSIEEHLTPAEKGKFNYASTKQKGKGWKTRILDWLR